MRVLITAGPTVEFLDSVRFFSNSSSGRMGYAIAKEALGRAHDVVLITGPVSLSPPKDAQVFQVTSAVEMLKAARLRFEECDVAIMAAAVCDYRPKVKHADKLKKGNTNFTIQLEPTEDICAALGAVKEHRKVIGFALEDHNHHKHAENKLARKQCDMIILNSPENIGANEGAIEIYSPATGWSPIIRGAKATLASAILDAVEGVALRT